MNYGIANQNGIMSQNQVNEIIHFSVSNGIMTFDTAQSYGDAEFKLGNYLKKGELEEIKIITKLDPSLACYKKSDIKNAIAKSIKLLNVKKIYGFLGHNIETLGDVKFLDAVAEAKNKKLIDKFGVSIYTPEEALIALSTPGIELLQIPFNIIDHRWIEMGIIEQADERDIELYFRSIFLQGFFFLTEKQLKKKNMNWALPYHRKLSMLIEKTGYSVQDITFTLLSNVSKNSNIIVGIDNLVHLKKNLLIFEKNKNSLINLDFSNWWKNLPNFPERLLNPTLW